MSKSTTERGYGADHQAERKRWQRELNRGAFVQCSRAAESYCSGEPIRKGDPWELDHTDDRTGYLGPAHPICNRIAGSRALQEAGHTHRDW